MGSFPAIRRRVGARLSERRERPGRPSNESAPAARGEALLLGILYRYLRTAPIITCGNAEATSETEKELRRGPRGACRHGPAGPRPRGPIAPPPTPTLCPTATFIPPTQFVSGVRSSRRQSCVRATANHNIWGHCISLAPSSESPLEPSSPKIHPCVSQSVFRCG